MCLGLSLALLIRGCTGPISNHGHPPIDRGGRGAESAASRVHTNCVETVEKVADMEGGREMVVCRKPYSTSALADFPPE